MDGWITPSRKRPRPNSPDIIELDSNNESIATEEGHSSSSINTSKKTFSSGSTCILINAKSASTRPMCQYGNKCYRRNPSHLLEFFHPFLEKVYDAMKITEEYTQIPIALIPELNKEGTQKHIILEQIQALKESQFSVESKISVGHHQASTSTSSSNICNSTATKIETGDKLNAQSNSNWNESLKDIREKRKKNFIESRNCNAIEPGSPRVNKFHVKNLNMNEKWEASCPFNFFLTKVTPICHEPDGVLSASFIDLFDPSLGEIKASCHINFMIDPEWLMDQIIQAGLEGKPTRIIFNGDSKDLHNEYQWLKIFGVKSPFPFGHHHTKMSIVQYTDSSIRFMIYTANLIESDWDKRTQGIWIGPKCSKLDGKPSLTAGESCTKFKSDIIQYLSTYHVQATAAWIDVIKSVDCSAIKVYLIASAPVTAQSGSTGFQWGISKVDKILKSLDSETERNWPLIIQCSSIGTLGKGPQDWIQGELGAAFSGKDKVLEGPIHVIYPSHLNVKGSFDGLHGGGCLPYSASTHKKQPWLERHLCQWKADRSGRSRAIPHIKSYCRISPDNSKMAWFLLTSANLSKAAWGKFNTKRDRLSVMSYEAGVLFVPQLLTSENHFSLKNSNSNNSSTVPTFPVHFDIPVVKYNSSDRPWLFDTLQALIHQSSSGNS